MPQIWAILPVGTENLGKLAQIAQISRDSRCGWANWADFAQFAVNFESSIFRGPNRKMVGKFCVICQKVRIATNFDNFAHGYREPQKLAQIARISLDSW